MKLIICVDDRWGLAFNRRRQSRDAQQRRHLLKLTEGATLRMSLYSARLFGDATERIIISDHPAADAAMGEFVFLECADAANWSEFEELLESVYVYHWGRSYPSDVRVPEDFREKLIPVRTEAFRGISHDRIVFEEYRYESE